MQSESLGIPCLSCLASGQMQSDRTGRAQTGNGIPAACDIARVPTCTAPLALSAAAANLLSPD
eukprot:778309-Pyramimonas_sp.AAC.1